jgi:hypothetical protein
MKTYLTLTVLSLLFVLTIIGKNFAKIFKQPASNTASKATLYPSISKWFNNHNNENLMMAHQKVAPRRSISDMQQSFNRNLDRLNDF